MRLVSAREYADLVCRGPKAIAGMRVVMPDVGRPLARGGADEDQAQLILDLVGKFFQGVCPIRQGGVDTNTPCLCRAVRVLRNCPRRRFAYPAALLRRVVQDFCLFWQKNLCVFLNF